MQEAFDGASADFFPTIRGRIEMAPGVTLDEIAAKTQASYRVALD